MVSVHLLVDDAYIDSFIQELPKEKVVVVENNFKENKQLLVSELNAYLENNIDVKSYANSMKDLTSWLKEKESL